jgi:F0F1-type ATP synthase assembly protein I
METIAKWVEKLLMRVGVTEAMAPYLRLLVLLVVLGFLAWVFYRITRRIVKGPIYRYIKRSKAKWDDLLMDNKIFSSLAHIVPVIIIRIITPILFRDFEKVLPLVIKLTDIYLIVVILMVISALLRVAEQLLSKNKSFADKPISSYFQLIRIILYIAAGIFILSVLIGKSPGYLLGAFGAMTALLMLIFKDTILGLVASIQISANDILRIGDWVEMPKFNADGVNHRSNQMSGGQQQRVAIARALVNDPVIILADEATGNLDTRTSFEILTLFQDFHAQGRTILFVTHNHEIARYGSRNIVLRDGRVIEDTRNKNIASAKDTLASLPAEEEE